VGCWAWQVADDPFTTLVPDLGVVPVHPEGAARGESFGKSLVFADVPGLLEGRTRAQAWATSSCATRSAAQSWSVHCTRPIPHHLF